ncbi:uncharacterized protein LOC127131164 [Lathyrus oleraceus]|uniref:uncharacterized protein LOC127131164 n=1 Tax=Pisum sativum TaxID=3888 RepID=UPI0021D10677|nr:uncharacterized protein LOC127131164 [Pisum sativum]
MYSCKQLGGYPTLLQCWIHEYFPTVGKRGENWKPADNCGLPRAMRWSYRQGVLKVDDLQPILDELTPADVIWRPFEDHRAWRVFDEICLYRGCLKWGETVVPYLPDRCLRQFGYRQYVPSPPLDCMMATDIDVDWISYHQSVIAVIGSSTVATTPSDVKDDYQLAPTLKEYYHILGIGIKNRVPFICTKELPKSHILDESLHLEKKEVELNLKLKGGIHGFTSKFLVDKATTFADAGSWMNFNAILDLLIYEIVLFLNIEDFVDLTAIHIFLTKNPVPTILADTYYSIHVRTQKKKGTII